MAVTTHVRSAHTRCDRCQSAFRSACCSVIYKGAWMAVTTHVRSAHASVHPAAPSNSYKGAWMAVFTRVRGWQSRALRTRFRSPCCSVMYKGAWMAVTCAPHTRCEMSISLPCACWEQYVLTGPAHPRYHRENTTPTPTHAHTPIVIISLASSEIVRAPRSFVTRHVMKSVWRTPRPWPLPCGSWTGA